MFFAKLNILPYQFQIQLAKTIFVFCFHLVFLNSPASHIFIYWFSSLSRIKENNLGLTWFQVIWNENLWLHHFNCIYHQPNEVCNELTLALWFWIIWKLNVWFHCFTDQLYHHWNVVGLYFEFPSEFSFSIIYYLIQYLWFGDVQTKSTFMNKISVTPTTLFLLLLIEMKVFRFNECK